MSRDRATLRAALPPRRGLLSRRQRFRALEAVNLLELAPVRLAAWTECDGRVIIERPKPAAPALRRPGEWLRYWLAVRRIRLDERGSHAWELLDGSRTVADVAEALRRRFGESVEPAEERAGELVRRLHAEDLVAYPEW